MLFRFETTSIARARSESTIHRAVYITGRELKDEKGNLCKHPREDVLWEDILLPPNAPAEFRDLQALTMAMEAAEHRKNSRTARQYIISLPNEVPSGAQIYMTRKFTEDCFTTRDLGAIVSIHTGRNPRDFRLNNPHIHLLVSTRVIASEGFGHKDRVLDSKEHLNTLKNTWIELVNSTYEHYQMEYRISRQHLREIELDRNFDFPGHTY